MSSSNKEDIINRVRKFMAVTVERGASEAEAMTALKNVNKLMAEYDLSMTEVEVSEMKYGARKGSPAGERRRAHEINRVAMVVGQYWDCRVWTTYGNAVVFFGSADDTLLAHQMLTLIYNAMESEWASYLGKSNGRRVHGKTLRVAFMTGMIIRITERLEALKDERSGSSVQANALVVVRGAVVTDKFRSYRAMTNWNAPEDFGLDGKRRAKVVIRSSEAYLAGKSAGDRVDLGGKRALADA